MYKSIRTYTELYYIYIIYIYILTYIYSIYTLEQCLLLNSPVHSLHWGETRTTECNWSCFFLCVVCSEINQNSGLPSTSAYWVRAYNAWCCTGCLLRIVEPALVRGLHYQHTLLYMCEDVLPLVSYIVHKKYRCRHNPPLHTHTNKHTHLVTLIAFCRRWLVNQCAPVWATAHFVWQVFACFRSNPPPCFPLNTLLQFGVEL